MGLELELGVVHVGAIAAVGAGPNLPRDACAWAVSLGHVQRRARTQRHFDALQRGVDLGERQRTLAGLLHRPLGLGRTASREPQLL